MAENSERLADVERRGEAAGRAAAEQDHREGSHAERVTSFEALADAAHTAASDTIQRSNEPYGDALKMAEEAFTNAYMDAYIIRLGELTSTARE